MREIKTLHVPVVQMDCAPAALSCTGRAVVNSHLATRVTLGFLFLICNGKAPFDNIRFLYLYI